MDLPGTAAVKAAGQDLLSAMRARSPGERQAGALTTKGKRERPAPVSAMLPVAQENPVLAAPTVLAPVAAAPLAAAVAPAVLPPAALAPAALAPIAAGGIGAAGLLPLIPAAIVIAANPPGGGGNNPPPPPGGGGGGVTPPPPPPGPAVPEPATWAMMIIGFGLLGAFLRRRSRNEIAGSAPRGTFAVANGSRSNA
jgi:hypothetical protein